MDTEVLLRRVLDLVNSAPKMPLSSTVRLEKDEVVEMLEEAIARLPEEMRQARWLLKEREDFLGSSAEVRGRDAVPGRGEFVEFLGLTLDGCLDGTSNSNSRSTSKKRSRPTFTPASSNVALYSPCSFRVPIREVRLSAGAGFITALVGRIDPSTRQVELANAGHCHPMRLTEDAPPITTQSNRSMRLNRSGASSGSDNLHDEYSIDALMALELKQRAGTSTAAIGGDALLADAGVRRSKCGVDGRARRRSGRSPSTGRDNAGPT